MTETSVSGGDAALRQITLTTGYLLLLHRDAWLSTSPTRRTCEVEPSNQVHYYDD